MSPNDVLQLIKDREVKFVDLRFTDTKGKEQHVSVPSHQFSMSQFESGHAFDGSSIAGWKGIEASDMLLVPDADSARNDPFTDETVLNFSCDVVEPADGLAEATGGAPAVSRRSSSRAETTPALTSCSGPWQMAKIGSLRASQSRTNCSTRGSRRSTPGERPPGISRPA
jgi:hypothetical protein